MKKTKRQIVKDGDVLQIHLRNGKYMYGVINQDRRISFFKEVFTKPLKDILILVNKEFLFTYDVYIPILNSGIWPRVGKLQLTPEQQKEELCCAYSELNDTFYFYPAGKETKISYKDCWDFEPVAVASRWHIEERLLHYTKTGQDHPRMWERYRTEEYLRKKWKDLYSPAYKLDHKKMLEEAKASGWYPEELGKPELIKPAKSKKSSHKK